MIDIAQDVAFYGLGNSPVAYYRAMLPAMALGCDWAGVAKEPPDLLWLTGLTKQDSALPDPDEYKVIVLQQPNKPGWFDFINERHAKGQKVLFEIDDYLHGIQKVLSHDFRQHFDKSLITRAETMMKMCDGIICSTEFLAKRYRKFGPTYVCKNGLDLKRYDLTLPKRGTVNIGWAGATGHKEAVGPWLQRVADLMYMRENTCFVSVGQMFALAFQQPFGEERAIGVPFCSIEQYPSAMTMFDIALAPAGKGSFFRGKSDLRWLEAGALGIPIIADPMVYPEIEDGVTGFHAVNGETMFARLMRLVDDEELRTGVGASAQEYVRENRSFPRAAEQWADVFEQVVDS